MSSILMFLYGVATYAFFFATFVYAIAFVGDLPVPRTVDAGVSGPAALALAVDLALLALFAVQHSVMARPAFKRWWRRFVPDAVERSTYVLAASGVLALLMWQWRPITAWEAWHVTSPSARTAIWTIFWLGWAVLLISTFLINHFDLFGLRQVHARLRGRVAQPLPFTTPGFYRYVRHPLYVGFLLSFWAAPTMTAGHLLFAIGSTAYVLLGIWFEERDLVDQFGDRYRRYRETAGMLWPRLLKR